MQWSFCNTTAETQKISEVPLWVGSDVNFHQLAILISAAAGLAACTLSFFLMWMHALNYTKPAEQRQIIRILLMIPIYSASNFLQLYFYHHAVYYAVISDCYEAFAISAFFQLMCQYMAPNLHEQKQFFRQLKPIKPWVIPVNWFSALCGGQRGPWRTPKSGLTWFNIIWIGVYHYCFIRVAMTIVAVVTQHYERYCASSLSPLFSHVWVIAVECVAVAIAMYCVIQYYVQFKDDMSPHKPGIKVVAIKGVIFLSFWQSTMISIASSWLSIIPSSAKLQYPDIATGIPALMLSVEMFIFAIVHIWAYPWAPYRPGAPVVFYPKPNEFSADPKPSTPSPPAGGFMGLKAFGDAFNFWDVIKAFGRGMRWLFVGVKRRHQDVSYQKDMDADVNMDGRSTYGLNQHLGGRAPMAPTAEEGNDEGVGLIANAADHPSSRAPSPFHEYEADPYESDLGYRGAGQRYHQPQQPPLSYESQTTSSYRDHQQQALALSTDDFHQTRPGINMAVYAGRDESNYPEHDVEGARYDQGRGQPRDTSQAAVGAALWGQNPHQHPNGPMI